MCSTLISDNKCVTEADYIQDIFYILKNHVLGLLLDKSLPLIFISHILPSDLKANAPEPDACWGAV
mgnify:CR=1 FL=1